MKLDELKTLAQKATPGPYSIALGSGGCLMTAIVAPSSFICDFYPDWATPTLDHRPDMNYIAALSPEVVLALITCVEAADGLRQSYRYDGYTAEDLYDTARAALEKP